MRSNAGILEGRAIPLEVDIEQLQSYRMRVCRNDCSYARHEDRQRGCDCCGGMPDCDGGIPSTATENKSAETIAIERSHAKAAHEDRKHMLCNTDK